MANQKPSLVRVFGIEIKATCQMMYRQVAGLIKTSYSAWAELRLANRRRRADEQLGWSLVRHGLGNSTLRAQIMEFERLTSELKAARKSTRALEKQKLELLAQLGATAAQYSNCPTEVAEAHRFARESYLLLDQHRQRVVEEVRQRLPPSGRDVLRGLIGWGLFALCLLYLGGKFVTAKQPITYRQIETANKPAPASAPSAPSSNAATSPDTTSIISQVSRQPPQETRPIATTLATSDVSVSEGNIELQSNEIIVAISFSPDGRGLFGVDANGQVTRWDLLTKQSQTFLAPERKPTTPSVFPWRFGLMNNQLLMSNLSSIAILPPKGTQIEALGAGNAPGSFSIDRPIVSADGRLALTIGVGARENGKPSAPHVILWDPLKGKKMYSFPLPKLPSTGLALSPDGHSIALLTTAKVLLLRSDNGEVIEEIAVADLPHENTTDRFQRIHFSPDGKYLALRRPFSLFQVHQEKPHLRLLHQNTDKTALGICFSENGRKLVRWSTQGLEVWDVAQWLYEIELSSSAGMDFLTASEKTGPRVVISADGGRIAFPIHVNDLRRCVVEVHDVTSRHREILFEPKGRNTNKLSLALSPDNNRLAVLVSGDRNEPSRVEIIDLGPQKPAARNLQASNQRSVNRERVPYVARPNGFPSVGASPEESSNNDIRNGISAGKTNAPSTENSSTANPTDLLKSWTKVPTRRNANKTDAEPVVDMSKLSAAKLRAYQNWQDAKVVVNQARAALDADERRYDVQRSAADNFSQNGGIPTVVQPVDFRLEGNWRQAVERAEQAKRIYEKTP